MKSYLRRHYLMKRIMHKPCFRSTVYLFKMDARKYPALNYFQFRVFDTQISWVFKEDIKIVWFPPVLWCSSGSCLSYLSYFPQLSHYSPITIGITVTFDALWILLISNARSWYLSTFLSSVLMMFWSAGTAMSISVHSRVYFCTRVIYGRLWFSFLSV